MNDKKMRSKTFYLKVWGDNACFTRPEMKVERVSYDVMTPSAARGVLEAILWKPAIAWHIERIDVLNPISWESVRRNEVGARMSPRSDGLFVDDPRIRQQRAGLFLRKVAYVIHAYFIITENGRCGRQHYQISGNVCAARSKRPVFQPTLSGMPGIFLAL
jgi:CRISPR-associated protein Cas5d